MDAELEAIASEAVDSAYRIHSKLEPGLLETVYEVLLARELKNRGHRLRRQAPVPIVFEGVHFDEGFRADLIVDDFFLIALKSVEEFAPVHGKHGFDLFPTPQFQAQFVNQFLSPSLQEGRETNR
jgi:GxxExxY protein